MRLRNRETGVIGVVSYISTSTGDILVSNVDDQEEWYHYKSLAGLNAEWEDVPEEATQVYIEGIQNVFMSGGRVYIDYATAKEAEESVRKLKAWKRLKDSGFVFCGKGDCLDTIKFDYGPAGYNRQDFNILFGGEE